MPRSQIVTQDINSAGLTPPADEAANVDGNIIDPGTLLHVKNASAGVVNVTVQTAAQVAGLDVADSVTPVAAGDDALIAGFDPAAFVRSAGATDPGKIYVDYDTVADVAVAAYRVVRT